MPKKEHIVWKHFKKLQKKPNNPYYMCICKYCDECETKPVELEGRIGTMENHLKKCVHYKALHPTETASASASVSSPSASSVATASSRKRDGSEQNIQLTERNLWKNRKIMNFMDDALTKNEIIIMQKRLVEMVADAEIPFTWIERPSTIRFFESIRPSLIQALPTPRALAGSLLRDHAQSSRDSMLAEMRRLYELGYTVCLVCHGWLDAGKRHFLGCVVSICGLSFSYDEALGEGNVILADRHDGVAIAEKIELAVRNTENEFGFRIGCVTTDEAGQCQRAKKILGLRFPNRYHGKCYAHQVSLILKDVFKSRFMAAVTRANSLVNKYIASSNRWYERLQRCCEEMYGTFLPLMRMIKVRWSSAQSCFASILRIQSALMLVQAKYCSDDDFPKELEVSTYFLNDLAVAEETIRPLCVASLMMQRDRNTLADVMNMFGYVYHSFRQCTASDTLVPLIEKRWKQQEIPLLIVAYMLHPKYVASFRRISAFQSQLQEGRMIQYCILYYKKYIGNDYGDLPLQVSRWFQEQYPEAEFYSTMPAVEFWCVMKPSCQELSALAMFVLCLAVQSATCEELFSACGHFSTKNRNRLHSKKERMLAQIRHEVLVMDKREAAASTEKKRERVVDAAERPKICHKKVKRRGERNAVEQILAERDDDSEAEEYCSDDALNNHLEDIGNSWLEALGCFEEELFEQDQESMNDDLEIANDVSSLKYSDGVEHRENYPYPNSHDITYPQEKLKGVRNMKLKLSELFLEEINLPSLI